MVGEGRMRMVGNIVALVLLATQCLGQEGGTDAVRRLRFRRPKPKLIDVENPEGDLVGRPVELLESVQELAPAEDLITAAQNSRPQTFPSRQHSGSAALDALIATAQREEPNLPAPQLLEIEEIPTQKPLDLAPVSRPRASLRSRVRSGLPSRGGRPRSRSEAGQQSGQGEPNIGAPRRRPAERDEPVATLERYNHKNEDGSFTFGYVGADGSFREETRGADCITRGKYGYIDPDGVKREYSYTSGLPCDPEEGENSLQDLEASQDVVDTVDPRERFRQTQNEQLNNNQIPEIRQKQIANRKRLPIRGQTQNSRPAEIQPVQAPQNSQASTFANFGSQDGGALQNLLTIADPAPAPQRPAPARAPVRIRPAPQPQPVQSQPSPAIGSFNFDSELEGFTLNRPAIKFEQSSGPPSNQFESQLSFNQNTGVFQTSLQQNLPGGGQIRTNNNVQPTRQSVTTLSPTTLAFSPTTPATRPQTVLPAGTLSIKPTFKPLNIPKDIGQVQPSLPEQPRAASPALPKHTPTPNSIPRLQPTKSVSTPRLPPPVPVPQAVPVPRPAPVPQAVPVTRPVPVPQTVPVTRPVPQTVPVTKPVPVPQTTTVPSPAPKIVTTPAAPKPAVNPAAIRIPPPQGVPNKNGFFVFQPFNQKPASAPFRTPVNPNAFKIQPQAQPPTQPQQPPQLISQAGRPLPQQGRPLPQPVAQPNRPSPSVAQPQLPPGVFAIPSNQPIPSGAVRVNAQGQILQQPARPPAAQRPQGAPQLQFGFQPVPQNVPQARPPTQVRPQAPGRPQNRPAPFTAFGGGVPPQQLRLSGQGAQLGVPPQLQRPGQFSQFDSRFAPRPASQGQLRPAQVQQQGLNVFNPNQLRGA